MTQFFSDRLLDTMRKKRTCVVVGFDPTVQGMPKHMLEKLGRKGTELYYSNLAKVLLELNISIIDAIAIFAVGVKPNVAFYSKDWRLMKVLQETIQYARKKGLIVIVDAKCGDGGGSADAYAGAFIGDEFSNMLGDAVTVNPFIADACVQSFVDASTRNPEKGVIVVTKTSFKPVSFLEMATLANNRPAWTLIAQHVDVWGSNLIGQNGYSNVLAVIGATYPDEAVIAREIMPRTIFLVPGYGAQNKNSKNPVQDAIAGATNDGSIGIIVNSSREIYEAHSRSSGYSSQEYAKAAAFAAEEMRDKLYAALVSAGKIEK